MPPKRRGLYTMEEVAEHNTARSLWVIMNRKVYDITVFHKRHPGGPAVLLEMGGRDATAAATAAHKSILPSNLMWEFCIGSIVRTKKIEATAPGDLALPLGAGVRQTSCESPEKAGLPGASPVNGPPGSVAPSFPAGMTGITGPPPAKAAGSPPSASAAKAKAKPKAKKVVAGEKAKVMAEVMSMSSADSGSQSAQEGGNDSDQDSDQGSPSIVSMSLKLPDFESEVFTSAMDMLYEKMLADPRLSRWAMTSPKPEMQHEVRRFLRAALEWKRQGASPASTPHHHHHSPMQRSNSERTLKRGISKDVMELKVRLESRFDDFADILVGLMQMQQPFSLGEDILILVMHSLSKENCNEVVRASWEAIVSSPDPESLERRREKMLSGGSDASSVHGRPWGDRTRTASLAQEEARRLTKELEGNKEKQVWVEANTTEQDPLLYKFKDSRAVSPHADEGEQVPCNVLCCVREDSGNHRSVKH